MRRLKAIHLLNPVPFETPTDRILYAARGTLEIDHDKQTVTARHMSRPHRVMVVQFHNIAAFEYLEEK